MTAKLPSQVLPEAIQEVYKKSQCLYSRQEVEAALVKIAKAINFKLANTNPILLCVVVGGIVTMGHLLPLLDFPLQVDYVHATRYQNTLKGKEITIKVAPTTNLQGRTVIIVDDILDGGITLQTLKNYCLGAGANAVYTVVLVDKQNAREPDGLERTDYCGLIVDNYYVFGYGLDYNGYLRNAPGIYKVVEVPAK